MAEVPEVIGCDEKIADLRDTGQPIDDLWKYNWKVSKGDMLFREMLRKKGYIPTDAEDEPRKWGCWITNFVKCPCRTLSWQKTLKGSQRKTDILNESAKFLADELRLIPYRVVVLMGRSVESYFDDYKDTLKVRESDIRWVYHYGRKSGKWETKYKAKFRKEVPLTRDVAK